MSPTMGNMCASSRTPCKGEEPKARNMREFGGCSSGRTGNEVQKLPCAPVFADTVMYQKCTRCSSRRYRRKKRKKARISSQIYDFKRVNVEGSLRCNRGREG